MEHNQQPTHVSRGNVLDELGFSSADSIALKVRAELLDAILAEIQRKAYRPSEVAKILDDYQPQISNLLTGKISKFSIEKLLRYAQSLELQPVLTLRPLTSQSIGRGRRLRRKVA